MTTLGVNPAPNLVTQFLSATNSVFPSLANAASIGGLSANTTDLTVESQLSTNVASDYYSFNFEQGSAIKLAFNNLTNTSGLQVQVLDSSGNVVADNFGTPAQQAAYASLDSDTGLSANTGTYYIKVGFAAGGTPTNQDYNFSLYSGTTYTNQIITSAQTQSYDPNLFISASASVTPSSNLSVYTQTATLPSVPTASNAISTGDLVAGSTELDVQSQITAANRSDNYAFNFQSGNAIKLAVTNSTNALDAVALRSQLIDSKGNVLADNYGTAAQQQAYKELTSGVGLTAPTGQYQVQVSAAPGVPVQAAQTYNFQLISGTAYATVYKTTANLPTATSDNAAGTNLNIFASSDAQAYSRQSYNVIGANAASAINIGWISENKTSLAVESQLSNSDNADWYTFSTQTGSSLKFAFADTNSASSAAPVRVQLYDVSGSYVFADNYGTAAQKAAYAELTSATGLAAKSPSQYTVKISYPPGQTSTTSQTYNFQIYSGNQYTEQDTTIASAQTYENAVLSGNTSVQSFSANAAAASYLNSLSSGTTSDIIAALSSIA